MEAEQLTLRHHRGTLYKKLYPINNKFLSKITCILPENKKEIMVGNNKYFLDFKYKVFVIKI